MKASRTSLIIARLMWLVPILLLALAAQQAITAYALRNTFLHGMPAMARVESTFSSNRSEISFDYVHLSVALKDGKKLDFPRFTIPHSFADSLLTRKEVAVRVLPESSEPVVLRSVGQAHWRLAGVNAVMSAVGFVLSFWGVGAWNGYLKRKGDPAYQEILG